MGLAMGDDFLIRRDAAICQQCWKVPAQTQRSPRIHKLEPVEIYRAGNAPGAIGRGAFAAILGGRTCIPDDDIRVRVTPQKFIDLNARF